MKKIVITMVSASFLCAGCANLGQPTSSTTGQSESWAGAALEIAKDPKCGHTDDVDIMLGAISTGHVHLNRTCPQPTPQSPPATDSAAPVSATPTNSGTPPHP